MNLLELLADARLIERGQIPELEVEMAKQDAKPEDVLQHAGVKLHDLLDAKGKYFGVPVREVGTDTVPFDVLRYVPEESARHYQIVPLSVTDGVLEVGIVDPENLEARDALTFISSKIGMPYKLFLITQTDFEKLLEQYKGLS